VGTFEAAVGPGALFGEELGSGGAAAGELAAQGARGDAWFRDGGGVVEGEDADDGAGRAQGLLALEGFGAVESLWGNGTTGAAVGARLGLEAVETLLLIDLFPAGESGGGEGAAGGIGDIVVAVGDLLAQPLLAAGRVLAPDQGQDEGVAEEGDLSASIFGIGHGQPPDKRWAQYSRKAGRT
jgi:hypothetical protein